MFRTRIARLLITLSLTASSLGAMALPTLACSCQAASPKVWHASGAIKSFGPNRAFVNIAHDDIPGYMNAMTMAFEAERVGLFDGLAVNDKVVFDFVEAEGARLVLVRIAKQ